MIIHSVWMSNKTKHELKYIYYGKTKSEFSGFELGQKNPSARRGQEGKCVLERGHTFVNVS